MSVCLKQRVPWMSQAAIDEMKTWDFDGKYVLEWGSGGSTLFFADRGAHVFSIEHNTAWYKRMVEITSGMREVCLSLCPPDAAKAKWAQSTIMRERTFAKYVTHAFDVTSERVFSGAALRSIHADIIVIDGRARPACLRLAPRLLAPGGRIVLDDADRSFYAHGIERMEAGLVMPFRREFVSGGPDDRGSPRHTYIWTEGWR